MRQNTDKRSFKEVVSAIPGPYKIILLLAVLLFLLVDIFGVNNYTGGFVFFTPGNILNVLTQVSLYAIIAFGMTLVIIIAGIDLSVGSMMALSGVVASLLIVNAGVPFWISLIIVVLIGGLIGIGHGYLVEKFTLPAFVVTLGSMIFFRGLSLILVDGTPVFNSNPVFLWIGNGSFMGIPIPIIIMLILFAVYHYLLSYTQIGKYIYAVGGNEEAAKLSGINIMKVKIVVFSLCTISAMVSGLILASRLGSGQPLAGNTWELYVITSVIIGGTSMSGGTGKISWTVAGAVIYGMINSGMNLLSIVPYYQWVIRGLVILVAVGVKEMSSRKNEPKHELLVE